jgi:hypothetical protein
MNQIPVFIVSPSIIIASHSTSPLLVNNDPRPALKYLLSSSKQTAFSTASTAVPPSCKNSLELKIGDIAIFAWIGYYYIACS